MSADILRRSGIVPIAELDHRALAVCWALWNGQIGTPKQTDRIQRQLSSADLLRMLGQRNVRALDMSGRRSRIVHEEPAL